MAEIGVREELFDDESVQRVVLYCKKCGFSYKTRHDVRNYCTNCGEKFENEKPKNTTPIKIAV